MWDQHLVIPELHKPGPYTNINQCIHTHTHTHTHTQCTHTHARTHAHLQTISFTAIVIVVFPLYLHNRHNTYINYILVKTLTALLVGDCFLPFEFLPFFCGVMLKLLLVLPLANSEAFSRDISRLLLQLLLTEVSS